MSLMMIKKYENVKNSTFIFYMSRHGNANVRPGSCPDTLAEGERLSFQSNGSDDVKPPNNTPHESASKIGWTDKQRYLSFIST